MFTLLNVNTMSSPIVTQAQVQNPFGEPTALQPKVAHTNFNIELVSTLKGFPTNMAFIGPDDILILSKNTGQVFRIKDGNNIGSVLKIDVTGRDEMGLLGIATDAYNKNKNQKNDNNVFLYYSCVLPRNNVTILYKNIRGTKMMASWKIPSFY